eukprot:Amastigsp_a351788_23.p3 type:complete len:134 gc:universal Amastigsp_a351788_23:579-178(-)
MYAASPKFACRKNTSPVDACLNDANGRPEESITSSVWSSVRYRRPNMETRSARRCERSTAFTQSRVTYGFAHQARSPVVEHETATAETARVTPAASGIFSDASTASNGEPTAVIASDDMENIFTERTGFSNGP